MRYGPAITSARPVKELRLGKYRAVLLDRIVSAGVVEYHFIMALFEGDSSEPCYFVSSEANLLAHELGGGSHFLCAFDENGHVNFGSSDKWADEEAFAEEALRMIKKKFGLAS